MASFHEPGSNSEVNTLSTVSHSHAIAERRRAALAEVDNARFSRFHAKVFVVAGVGFFTDAYDIFAINIASTMLSYLYGAAEGPSLNAVQNLGVKVATPIGTFCGQLLFGWLADVVGGKKMYGIELFIIIVATFGQAISGTGDAVSIIDDILFFLDHLNPSSDGRWRRGWLPFKCSHFLRIRFHKNRGRMMTAVFASRGWGSFDTILSSPSATYLHAVDAVWRLLIGFGCVPATVALYFRLTIPETPRFTMDIERNLDQASTDIESFTFGGEKELDEDAHLQRIQVPKASLAGFRNHFGKLENFKVLFGTSYSWFALGIAFYGLGLNSAIILQTIERFGSSAELNLKFY